MRCSAGEEQEGGVEYSGGGYTSVWSMVNCSVEIVGKVGLERESVFISLNITNKYIIYQPYSPSRLPVIASLGFHAGLGGVQWQFLYIIITAIG